MNTAAHSCPRCHSGSIPEGTATCPSCGAPVTPDDLKTLYTHDQPVTEADNGADAATEVTPTTGPPTTDPLLAPGSGPDEIGRLGPYRVLGRIGVGGMGLVFRAEDPHLRRHVALKVMLPQFTADPTARARFLREARAAAAVEHDHIVPIFQVGEDRGIPYLAMPLLKGESLSARLKASGPLPVFHAVRIGREIAEGLAAAHAVGLIHRDVKPSNVWLEGERRRVRLLDFGLARVMDGVGGGDSNRLLDKEVVGTPAYMSPEQARHETIDGRSDLFSLGVVLYQMVAGHLPFKTGSAVVTLTSVAMDDPQPPADLNPALPPELNTLILGLLAKRPEDRPASAAEVARRLADLEVELTAVPLPTGPVPAGGDPFADLEEPDTTVVPRPRPAAGRRWSRLVWMCLSAFVVAVGGGLVAFFFLPAPLGTLVIESEDPAAEIVVRRNGDLVRDRTKDRTIGLAAGDYTVHLAEAKNGVRLSADTVTVTRGGRTVVRVHRDKPVVPLPPPDPDRRAAEHYLARTGVKVKVQPATGPAVELVGISPVPAYKFSVIGLVVPQGGAFTPPDLKFVEGLSKLEAVAVHTGGQLGDDGIKPVAGLKKLTYLALPSCGLTDAGLKHLAGLTGLTHLNLNETGISDAGVPHLPGSQTLQWVWLSGTKVGDDGLERLASFPALTVLFMADTPVTNAGLAKIPATTKLVGIDLSGTQVTDDGMPHLARLRGLTHLLIGRTKVSDAGLGHLAAAKKLQALILPDDTVTEPGVRKLSAALPACTITWKGRTFGPPKK